MHLSSITLHGFKSFAEKTELKFSPSLNGRRSVTAIVGPNGSGKSNIADAVLWAMGEQRLKSIRGKRGEDVIFSGSEGRGRMGMAIVSIAIDNSEGRLPLPAEEVSITRRLTRSGESEYMVNGAPARLFDLEVLLAKASLAAGSYTVVGQGMVERLISHTPEERRALFDDACGIAELQIKRHQTSLKLSRAHEHMAEAGLVLGELAPRLKTLSRQAKKLEERQEVERKLREWQTACYATLHLREERALSEHRRARAVRDAELRRAEEVVRVREMEFSALMRSATLSEQFAVLQKEYQALIREDQQIEREMARLSADTAAISRNEAARVKPEQTESFASLLRDLRSIPGIIDAVVESVDVPEEYRAALNNAFGDSKASIVVATATAFERCMDCLKKERLGAAVFLPLYGDGRARLVTLEGDVLETGGQVHDKLSENQRREREFSADAFADFRERQARLDELKARRAAIAAELGRVEERLSGLQKGEEERRRHLLAIQDSARTAKEEAARIAARRHEDDLEIARLETRADELARASEAALHEPIEETARRHPAELSDEEFSRAQGEMQKCAYALSLIGGIDPGIAREYEETRARHDGLAGELADLEKAARDLAELEKELDGLMAAKRAHAFREIKKEFARYFGLLFGGGKADLVEIRGQVEENIENESGVGDRSQKSNVRCQMSVVGIDIIANPPGKRIAHVQALSGGERTMTALALLSAILRVNPSPFVVLDEVEAALDEANTLRFTQIIGELSSRTQFIIITHNRATMHAADTLYGVTMGGDGVSRLVSVKLPAS